MTAFLTFGLLLGTAAPAEAVGCPPICTISGVVNGSNLNLPLEGNFWFSVNVSGVRASIGGVSRTGFFAGLGGSMTRVDQSTSTGVGTMVVTHDEELVAGVPVRITARGVRGQATSAEIEPLSTLATGGGYGTTMAFLDGTLTGVVHVVRALPDEGTGVRSTLSAPPLYVSGQGFTISGMVETVTGTPLPGVPVDLVIDGADGDIRQVTTGGDGTWSMPLLFTGTGRHSVRAVALRDLPISAESPEVPIRAGHQVSVSVSGDGTVTGGPIDCPGTCSALVERGAHLTLTATPGTFFGFDAWSGDCQGGELECRFWINGVKSIGASFSLFNADVAEIEPNGTTGTALPSTVPRTIAGSLTAGDVDLVEVTFAEHTTLHVETFDPSMQTCDNIDTMVAILDEAGTELASDDDGGVAYCSLLTRDLLPGTYFVRVKPYGATTAPEYRLRLTSTLALEPNDDFATAKVVGPVGSTVATSIAPVGDIDHFSFTLDQSAAVAIDTFQGPGDTCTGIDTVIAVYDTYGSLLGTDDDGGLNFCSHLVVNAPAGTITVSVIEYGNNDVIPRYELRTSAHL